VENIANPEPGLVREVAFAQAARGHQVIEQAIALVGCDQSFASAL
jgi:hypothetical protein